MIWHKQHGKQPRVRILKRSSKIPICESLWLQYAARMRASGTSPAIMAKLHHRWNEYWKSLPAGEECIHTLARIYRLIADQLDACNEETADENVPYINFLLFVAADMRNFLRSEDDERAGAP